jgi:hypothetical protein
MEIRKRKFRRIGHMPRKDDETATKVQASVESSRKQRQGETAGGAPFWEKLEEVAVS